MVAIKSVLIVDGVGESCSHTLQIHGIQVTEKPDITPEQLLTIISDYEALVVGAATQVTSEVLDAGKELKLVARAGVDISNIDLDAANAKGIAVINVPDAHVVSSCELGCALLLALAKQVLPATVALKASGVWDTGLYAGIELKDKTLAILGLGRVGREVALRMKAFGMKIIAVDPFVSEEQCLEFYTTKVELEEIWPRADFIMLLADYVMYSIIGFDPFVTEEQCRMFYASKFYSETNGGPVAGFVGAHRPLIAPNHNFINADVLNICKKGVKIISVGRSGLINYQDLFDALNSGQVGGAALDAFEEEPPTDPQTLAVIEHPAVIATPHLGSSSVETEEHICQELAEQIVNLVKPYTYDTLISEMSCIYWN